MLEAIGFTFCAFGLAWHVRRCFPRMRVVEVAPVVKVCAPLSFDLELKRYEGSVAARADIKISEDVERDTVLAALDDLRARVAAHPSSL